MPMQEMQEMRVQFLGQEDPLEKEMATLSGSLPWKVFHGQRSLKGYSVWGRKESDTTEHAHIHCLTPKPTHFLSTPAPVMGCSGSERICCGHIFRRCHQEL